MFVSFLGQCENGIFTFEKVTGHFLRSAKQDMLNREKFPSGGSSGDSVGGGITVDCGRTCLEMGGDCPAYSVDYAQVWFSLICCNPPSISLHTSAFSFGYPRAVALSSTGTVKAELRN